MCYILNEFGGWNFVRTIRSHIELVQASNVLLFQPLC
jgi:hypothetical protein